MGEETSDRSVRSVSRVGATTARAAGLIGLSPDAASELRSIVHGLRDPDPTSTTVATARHLLKVADVIENWMHKFLE